MRGGSVRAVYSTIDQARDYCRRHMEEELVSRKDWDWGKDPVPVYELDGTDFLVRGGDFLAINEWNVD